MTITLRSDQEKAIKQAIQAGLAGSVDEFIGTEIRAGDFLVQLSTLNFRIDRVPHTTDFPRLHHLATKYRLTS